MSKILYLPLKKEWYEMIESGVKTEEYREIKPYWTTRLLKDFPIMWRLKFSYAMYSNDFSELIGRILHPVYKLVKFSYGYTKRTMTFELEKVVVGKGNKEWGAPDEDVFIIKLGRRVE